MTKRKKNKSRIISVRVPESQWAAVKSLKDKVDVPAMLKGQIMLLVKHLDAPMKGNAPAPNYYSNSTGSITMNYNSFNC